MSKLQQLKVFINERLKAAAQEIFGAVEKTLMECESEFYLSQEAVKDVGMLRLTEALKQERTETYTAVSLEVAVHETEASNKPANEDNDGTVVKQSTPGPLFQELQAHWSSNDEGKLQILLQGDAVASVYGACSKYDQSPQSSQNQTVDNREDPLLSSIEEIKSEEKDSYRDSEVDILSQPESLDCGYENDTRDAEWTVQTTVKSKKKTKQRPNRSKYVKSLQNNKDICYPPSYIEPAQTVESSEPRGTNVCYVCGKTFTTKGHLKRHMFGHTGLKPHGCKECGRTFARIESLRVHMRIHTLEIPYTCDICGKAFRHKGNMISHIRTHTGEKPHRCSICSKAYAYTQDLRKHMQIHAKKN